ncbi:DUF4129 domain-containing protein [Halovenus sp. WSH3]|uniref:DUF4129 domain-containing protein n=1 Tax=Halovenus carboxidivorans TaxID=2692199 RepID=A0A6B0T723_9EURY|nr:DUF4129 domain-containing protein [Halovenus carboxidivorans]MXR52747.1 DUF4129 domain-containing protein [Halovenus carboxidivorans]
MRRITFLGLGVVAVLALGLTAASVESGLQTVDPDLSGTDGQPRPPPERAGGQGGSDGGGTDSSDQLAETGETTDPSTAGQRSVAEMVLALVLFVLGGCLALYGLTRGDDGSTETTATPDSETETDPRRRQYAVADRPASNDLFRNWLLLEESAYPDRESVSPAEVRTAAIERGQPRQAVEELTAAFCAVRYGGAEATDELERRARRLGERLDVAGGEER